MKRFKSILAISIVVLSVSLKLHANPWVTYEGQDGPGKGKQVVLMGGDWEYRCEECLPMLGKILAYRHGFTCTVLFPINPTDGTIDPDVKNNIPGLEKLQNADLLILLAMMLELPDEQTRHIIEYSHAGKPIVAIRCSTLLFRYGNESQSPYAKYTHTSKDLPGGFSGQVLGGAFAGHHGKHKKESTRGLMNGLNRNHRILQGVKDIWGPTDVYAIDHWAPNNQVLVWGQVLQGMKPNDPPNLDKCLMPLVWIRDLTGAPGKTARVLTTTIGSSVDFECEDLRRLLVNGVYWGLGMEQKIPPKTDVTYVGPYEPSFFGRHLFRKGMKPEDYQN